MTLRQLTACDTLATSAHACAHGQQRRPRQGAMGRNQEDTEMGRESNVTALRNTTLLAVAFFGLSALVGTGSALADGQTIRVSGNSVPSECGAPKKAAYGIELSGSLAGCWAIFPQHLKCSELNGFAMSTELGREEFDGTLDGKPIKFDTQYTFTATWPSGSCPEPAPEKETTGSCIHYISGENVGGLMHFYDVIPKPGEGPTNFFYEGVLTLD
jgi:hypothetical protein